MNSMVGRGITVIKNQREGAVIFNNIEQLVKRRGNKYLSTLNNKWREGAMDTKQW